MTIILPIINVGQCCTKDMQYLWLCLFVSAPISRKKFPCDGFSEFSCFQYKLAASRSPIRAKAYMFYIS